MTIDSFAKKMALVLQEWWREMIVVTWFVLAFLIHYDWVQGITFEAMFVMAIVVIRLIQYPSGVSRQEEYPVDWHRRMDDDRSYSIRFPYRITPGNHGGELPPRFDDSWSSISTNPFYGNGYQGLSSSYNREEDYWRNQSSYQFDNSWSSISTSTTGSITSFDAHSSHQDSF